MAKKILVGIDIGTYATRVVVLEYNPKDGLPKIIGTGLSESHGMRHGYITNHEDIMRSIKRAVLEAEKNSNIKIKQAYISIGGVSLGSEVSSGIAVISKADSEVTILDVNKAIGDSGSGLSLANKKILDVVPIMFKIDGKEVLGRPEGMKGVKLEVKNLFITCNEQHEEDLMIAVESLGIEVLDIIPSPLAESLIVLGDRQKIAGCALVNIGSETVIVSVFENGNIVALQTFQIGSTDITNDIALGLKITLEEAEDLKTGNIESVYPKKKLDQIIDARLYDIFELIDNYLKKIKRSELLPAGVIITGGGSNMTNIENLAKNILKLPAKTAFQEVSQNSKIKIKDHSFYTALGLCFYQLQNDDHQPTGNFSKNIKNVKNFLSSIIKQILP